MAHLCLAIPYLRCSSSSMIYHYYNSLLSFPSFLPSSCPLFAKTNDEDDGDGDSDVHFARGPLDKPSQTLPLYTYVYPCCAIQNTHLATLNKFDARRATANWMTGFLGLPSPLSDPLLSLLLSSLRRVTQFYQKRSICIHAAARGSNLFFSGIISLAAAVASSLPLLLSCS